MKRSTFPIFIPGGLAAMLASLVLALVPNLSAYEVIDPSGASYFNVTESSRFAPGWEAINLFTTDVSGVPVGGTLSGDEYAKAGGGDAWVAFEVDQSYPVGSIFWAQRNGANTGDNMQRLSLWTSEDAAFAAADPGTAPQNVINLLPNSGAPVWREYFLSNVVSGRYFLMHLEQTDVRGNPGGAEMRLGLNPPPTAPVIAEAPQSRSIYANGSVRFSVSATGSFPLSYQWARNGTALSNGVRISGATSPELTITDVTAADAGNYTVTVTNPEGSTTSTAAVLTLLGAPANELAQTILENDPVAYWQLNESAGATVAADFVGGLNGLYGIASGVGVAGPRPAQFPGFLAANNAVQTFAFQSESAVALPPLRLNTNRVTLIAWIRPDGSAGPQNPYTGIVYSRGSGTSAGLIFGEDGTKLGYQWNNDRYQFDSALTIPPDQWSMVALVVTPTNSTLYSGSENRLRSAVDVVANAVQTFEAPTYIGLDTDLGQSARTFNGVIDEVAVFNRSLTELEIQEIYQAGAGALQAAPVAITGSLANQALFYGEALTLQAKVSGTQPISFQWFRNGAAIAGATNATYFVPAVTTANAGSYHFTASNTVNSITSDAVEVTVANTVLRVLDPTGKAYTEVQHSSAFAANWGASNLFTTDVSNIPVGGTLPNSSPEYAKSGPGDAWVAFSVDRVYDLGAVYWAQRFGSGTGDNMQVMSVWASETSAFAPEDPLTAPQAVINLEPNSGTPVWVRYLLESNLRGRHFLLHLEQTDVRGNPGGAEMRLGLVEEPQLNLPVQITGQPANQSLFSGDTLTLEVSATGSLPLQYQWYQDNTPIAGATSSTLTVADVTPANAGSYYVVVSNAVNAVTSASAQVEVASHSLEVLDPTGEVYTNVRHSSAFAANWGATNLFSTDVSAVEIGGVLPAGAEYARAGGGDAWVAFEVDKSYEVGAVYWAQRLGSTTGDNMQVLSLWARDTEPFATEDPGTAADAVIQLEPNTGNPIWLRYLLEDAVSGRYFLAHLEQTDVRGNPGGAEMRLGVIEGGTGEARVLIARDGNGVVLTWPEGGTLEQAENVEGPWSAATGVINGTPFVPGDQYKFYRVRF